MVTQKKKLMQFNVLIFFYYILLKTQFLVHLCEQDLNLEITLFFHHGW